MFIAKDSLPQKDNSNPIKSVYSCRNYTQFGVAEKLFKNEDYP